jgi:hypothetical protein
VQATKTKRVLRLAIIALGVENSGFVAAKMCDYRGREFRVCSREDVRLSRLLVKEALVRSGILALTFMVAACSSSSTSPPPSDPTASAALLKKDCADPKWKEENLGLWYSVCRQPLRW